MDSILLSEDSINFPPPEHINDIDFNRNNPRVIDDISQQRSTQDINIHMQASASSNNTAFNESMIQMYSIFENSFESIRQIFRWIYSYADPRVDDWPLMSTPWPVLFIFGLYLLLARYGLSIMQRHKPFRLRWILVVYNLYIALLNLWIACEIIWCAYKLRFDSLCQLVKVDYDPYVLRIANAVWWYFASKGIEFADTLFFILRKKDRQLTFLHVYHHSTMFLVWWTAVRFVPGGSAIIPIIVNSSVHVLMYTYYGLSAIGPSMQKYLWWKKHLTIIQLIQFVVGVSIGIRLITTDCRFTMWMQYVFSAYAGSFIILFGNFYLNEYTKKGQTANAEKSPAENKTIKNKKD